MCIRKQSLPRGASQSAVRPRWLSLCTVWPSHSQISSLSTAILAVGKSRNLREPNLCFRGADRLGWCDALPEKPARELYNGQAECSDEADLLAPSVWILILRVSVNEGTLGAVREEYYQTNHTDDNRLIGGERPTNDGPRTLKSVVCLTTPQNKITAPYQSSQRASSLVKLL